MVGQLLAVNEGALCSLVLSAFNVNWSEPLLHWMRLHGTATRFPLAEPAVLLDPMPGVEPGVPLLLLVPGCVELVPVCGVVLVSLWAELLPGAPLLEREVDEPLSDRTTNCTWPLVGSIIRSFTWPTLSPVCPLMDWFISLLARAGLLLMCELLALE
jgi:hypothetical protein